MKEYDAIFPIGGGCPVAYQLSHRGKRLFATPFDWTYIKEPKGLAYIARSIQYDFADLALQENLSEIGNPLYEKGIKTWRYLDKLSGIGFIHHFHGNKNDPKEYKRFREQYTRRLKRMLKRVDNSSRILFILQASIATTNYDVEIIYNALVKRFPETEIHLCAMLYCAEEDSKIDLLDGFITIIRIRRDISEYDLKRTSSEWAFLDELSLRGRPTLKEVRKKIWIKLLYKMWQWAGKTLERSGAGCHSIRYRQ